MTSKENCERCNIEFIPKNKNEIWSSYTYEDPSCLIGYICDNCLNKELQQEREYSKQEQQFYDNYKEDLD